MSDDAEKREVSGVVGVGGRQPGVFVVEEALML